MTLDNLAPGHAATIARISGERAFRRRLLELGLLPGTRIERTGQAPLGDPLTFRIRGAVIGLRRVDARAVDIDA